jgi:hypothetical protein
MPSGGACLPKHGVRREAPAVFVGFAFTLTAICLHTETLALGLGDEYLSTFLS